MQTEMLFVVGAGASAEAGLPCGRPFRNVISTLLNMEFEDFRMQSGDKLIWDALKQHANQVGERSMDPYFAAARRISGAMSQALSIDTFIDNNAGDQPIELCGKLAIVRAILAAEASSSMIGLRAPHSGGMFASLEATWYPALWRLLVHRCTSKADFAKRLESIAMIVFNYDRCIEHYLFHSLQGYFACSEAEAAKILTHLRVYHPYGTVGRLPWQGSPYVAFGADAHSSHLLAYASGIKTFTERIDAESSEIVGVRQAIFNAKRIVFLGFGFDENNMALLTPTSRMHPQTDHTDYFATAHGLSASNCSAVVHQLRTLKRHGGIFEPKYFRVNNDLKAGGLFDEYWKSLLLPAP
jgi:hypothetical protein